MASFSSGLLTFIWAILLCPLGGNAVQNSSLVSFQLGASICRHLESGQRTPEVSRTSQIKNQKVWFKKHACRSRQEHCSSFKPVSILEEPSGQALKKGRTAIKPLDKGLRCWCLDSTSVRCEDNTLITCPPKYKSCLIEVATQNIYDRIIRQECHQADKQNCEPSPSGLIQSCTCQYDCCNAKNDDESECPEILSSSTESPASGDYEKIVEGVTQVSLDKASPGFLTVFGSSAFPILAGRYKGKTYLPIGAASVLAEGRIIGFSHTDFLALESPKKSDRNQLILNSVKWAANGGPDKKLKLGTVGIKKSLIDFLKESEMDITEIDAKKITKIENLQNYDGVVAVMHGVPSAVAVIMKEFAKNGGGLVLAATSWAFGDPIDGPFSTHSTLNMISMESGFVWRGDQNYASTSSEDKTVFLVSNDLTQLSYMDGIGWNETEKFLSTGEIVDTQVAEFEQVAVVLSGAALSLPASKDLFSGERYELLKTFGKELPNQPVPQQKEPVTTVKEKLKLRLFWALHFFLDPEDVAAHPASKFFPGEVKISSKSDIEENVVSISFKRYLKSRDGATAKPEFMPHFENRCDGNPAHSGGFDEENEEENNDNFEEKSGNFEEKSGNFEEKNDNFEENSDENSAETESQSRLMAEDQIQLNVTHTLWFSTGFYAPPGQVIEITAAAAQKLSKCSVLIGCHRDDTTKLSKWWRVPIITKVQKLVDNKLVIASPYGGIIYFIVPDSQVSQLDVVNLTVKGGVKYTHKVLDGDYKRFGQNHSNVPWVELETENVVLTFPYKFLPSDDDVEFLLAFWNQVLDAIADLAQIPRKRARQERLVIDIQISAGALHSGYPIMAPFAEASRVINVTKMFEGSSLWGWFHELGHNHQAASWTFGGTGDVTNNIFVCYLFETLLRIPFNATRAELSDDRRKKMSEQHFANGTFAEWKGKFWLALSTYMELRQLYGWRAFKLVFQTYGKLSTIGEKEPKNDQQKIDLFNRVFSKVVNQDLTDFFKKWKWPLSK